MKSLILWHKQTDMNLELIALAYRLGKNAARIEALEHGQAELWTMLEALAEPAIVVDSTIEVPEQEENGRDA